MSKSIRPTSGGAPLRLVQGSNALKTESVQTYAKTVTSLEMPPNIHQNEDFRELWQEIVPDLVANGLVTKADVPAIALMIRHYHAALAASDELAEVGPTVEGRYEDKKNPAEVVFRSQSMSFAAYARELGMTLGARVRGKLPDDLPESDDDNPFS